MPPAAVATPTAADVCNEEMEEILSSIAANVWREADRPTDLWLRLGNLVQTCPLSTLHVQSHTGFTALSLAARCRKPLICSLLLARGAVLKESFVEDDGVGVLFKLLLRWNLEHRRWDDEGACSRARTREVEVVRVLTCVGTDADMPRFCDYKALRYAGKTGNVEVLKIILAASGETLGWGKNAVVVIDGDRCPFRSAIGKGCLEVVKVLCGQEFRPKVLAVTANDGGLSLGRFVRRKGFDELAEFIEGFAWDKIA